MEFICILNEDAQPGLILLDLMALVLPGNIVVPNSWPTPSIKEREHRLVINYSQQMSGNVIGRSKIHII